MQSNHVHLVAEATDRRALSRGLQGLAIRIARSINRDLGVSGRVFADRYHARALKTPLEVKNALRYVLQNAAHHGRAGTNARYILQDAGHHGCASRTNAWLDPCSSASSFLGWLGRSGRAATALVSDDAVTPPRTWLLRVGWRKHGLLRARDKPAS